MKSHDSPEFIKLEIRSISPESWTFEFKWSVNENYDVLAFHQGIREPTSEALRGQALREHVAALNRVLQAIQQCPQSGKQRVIADGIQIEVRTPAGRFKFFTVEEGDNGKAFQHCLQLACSATLDASTYQRWRMDTI